MVLKDGAKATRKSSAPSSLESFAKWQLPDAFVFVPEIPPHLSGQIQKNRPTRTIRQLELGIAGAPCTVSAGT